MTFEHFGVEQGALPMISCIFQDRTGYLWFGTPHGVLRYDGYTFKRYINFGDDSSKVTNAAVEAICDDSEGNIWIGHVQGLDKLNPTTEEVIHYILNPKVTITDWSNHVLALLEDRNGNLWVGTGGGLYLYVKTKETFKSFNHDSTDLNSLIHNAVNAIYEDMDGTLWLGTGSGLEKLDYSGNKFIHYWIENSSSSPWTGSAHWILTIFEDSDGIIWLGTTGGLVEFSRKDDSFTLFKHNLKDVLSSPDDVIRTISEDLNGNLWIGSNRLIFFNKNNKKFFDYTRDELDLSNFSGNGPSKILVDKSGIIWIATFGGGINKYVPPNKYVKKYTIENAIITNTGWGNLVEDNNGKIWIGTDKGLISFDPNREVFTEEPLKKNITGILLDKQGTIWINSWLNGNLYYKKDNDQEIKQFFYSDGKAFYEAVTCMDNCRDSCIWIGTSDGKILKLNQNKKVLEQIAQYDNNISAIYEDKAGLLWIGTSEAGVICYDPELKSFTRYYSDPKDSSTLNSNLVSHFCEDGAGTLWIITASTLNKFDKINQKCVRWSGKEGFPKDAMSITDDNSGNLWMSTGSGAVKYDPLTKKLTKYNDIKLGWGYSVRSGELYFVSTTFFSDKQCIMKFNPSNIANNRVIPPIVITSFKKFEKSYPFGKTIEINYTENFLSFEFSALSYISPEKNQYAYMMEGVDKDWVYSGTRRFASYPNLDPGEYLFRVKGSNNDGVWNEEGTSVAIIISPPFWKTWWAYTSYASLFIFALYGLRRYELNRIALKNKIKVDGAILKEKEETDKIKSQFFANISHEFRTPLTLILGPAEKIEKNQSTNPIKDASIITRNSKRLLQLVNQLLDLSKLDAGKLKLEASPANIVSFIKGLALSFESLSEARDVMIKIKSDKEFIEVYFDMEKMFKAFSNLLSNAFKFTPERENVIVTIAETVNNTVEIRIRNTGIGIPQKELPKLFDRFYQVDSSQTKEYEGTGIGLALVKELIELHHGSISVESKESDPEEKEKGWTEFKISLPLGRAHLKDDEVLEEKVILSETKNLIHNENQIEVTMADSSSSFSNRTPQADDAISETKTTILVVEDNYDMREYIKESLSATYAVEEAVNGEQGVRVAEMIIPDLIISDLMMPKMDGNELTRILKNDERTSHIPIILLTAKSGQENKIEGLHAGADDYLTKPFDLQELRVRVENLINIRKKLQEKFSKGEFLSKRTDKKLKSIDEKFLAKVLEVIEKHISEEEFSIEECSSEVGLSRTHFHKKLRALVGKSPSQYVRTVRLNRAKQMIEEEKGNVSEVAYSVGFSSPAYFSKCFKEEFGYPPRDIIS